MCRPILLVIGVCWTLMVVDLKTQSSNKDDWGYILLENKTHSLFMKLSKKIELAKK